MSECQWQLVVVNSKIQKAIDHRWDQDGRISSINSPPQCLNQQTHQIHCPAPPLCPSDDLHPVGVEDDPSIGSSSSKVTGSSTGSLRSVLANANSVLLSKPISSRKTSHIFLFPFTHSPSSGKSNKGWCAHTPSSLLWTAQAYSSSKCTRSHMCSNSSHNKRMK